MKRLLLLLLPVLLMLPITGCGIYSFTGASIQGKTINIHIFENRARNIVPTLSPTLTNRVRNDFLSRTGLTSVNSDAADYDMAGVITTYELTISGVQNTQQASQNRLTIAVTITFKNRLDEKGDFTETFSKFKDFPASQTLQSVENVLIEDIGEQLSNAIFNKAFVNW